MAEPSLPAVMKLDDSARRPTGHLILDIRASAGGSLTVIDDSDDASRDVTIRGGNSSAFAHLLSKRGCAFVSSTDYGNWSLVRHRSRPKTPTVANPAKEPDKHLKNCADPVALTDNSSPDAIS